MNKQLKFFSVISLQILILISIILVKLTILTSGTIVFLRIAPVDPRDPLRGDFATFSYDISRISSYQVSENIKTRDTVYVSLRGSGKYYYMTKASIRKPTNGDLFIKGTVTYAPTLQNNRNYSGSSEINVKYGIEDFFIPEGSGTNIGVGRQDTYYSEVAIDDNGNAVLKKVYKNDKPIN